MSLFSLFVSAKAMTTYGRANNNANNIQTHLVFSDGLYQGTIDKVDGKSQNQNDDVLGHSSAEGISTGLIARCVHGWR